MNKLMKLIIMTLALLIAPGLALAHEEKTTWYTGEVVAVDQDCFVLKGVEKNIMRTIMEDDQITSQKTNTETFAGTHEVEFKSDATFTYQYKYTNDPTEYIEPGCKVTFFTDDITDKLDYIYITEKPKKPVERNLTPDKEFQSAHFILNKNHYFKNEFRQNMDAITFALNGRTYVPFRYLAYALGVAEEDVTWDAATKEVTLALGDITEKFTVGSTTYYVNGQNKTMDVGPIAKEGRTYLPARFVAEAFGYNAGYDGATGTVTISKGGDIALPQAANADPFNPPLEYDDMGVPGEFAKFGMKGWPVIKVETARKLFGDLVLPENLIGNGKKLAIPYGSRDVIVNPEVNSNFEVIAGTGIYLKNHLSAPLVRRDSTYKDRSGNIETSNPEYYPLKELLLLGGFPEQNIFWNPNTKTIVIYGDHFGKDEYYSVVKITAGQEYDPGNLVAAPLMENGSLLVNDGDYNQIVAGIYRGGDVPTHNGGRGYTADPNAYIKWME